MELTRVFNLYIYEVNNHWAWIVMFQALNKRNFAIVKYYKGVFLIAEIYF